MALRHWWTPVRHLRRELGLRETCNPLFRDKFSPDLVLALFSSALATPQPDWPSQTFQAGFVYYDRQRRDADSSSDLTEFLASGDAPIVFTLGSTAVHNPGGFYEVSVQAAKQLGRRAVLLGISGDSPGMLALPYAPYSKIFPHASAIVHQGGSGTTGQALRAGRPELIVPYGWDQPDNGARVQRLGAGLCLARKAYSVQSAAAALKRLLADSSFAARAAAIALLLQKEEALICACDAIESVLMKTRMK